MCHPQTGHSSWGRCTPGLHIATATRTLPWHGEGTWPAREGMLPPPVCQASEAAAGASTRKGQAGLG